MRTVTSWFGSIELHGTSEAQRRVIDGVEALLSQLKPARLDRTQTVVEWEGGETWVKLVHDSEPGIEIRFVLSDGWVNFYGVMGHDEAYNSQPEPADAWEAETINILADLLRSNFRIDNYTLGGKPWREVLTIDGPYNRTSTEMQSLTSVLPLTRWAEHVGSRAANFGCSGVRSPER
jgi:hypothetical protein